MAATIVRISDYERPIDTPKKPDDPPCEVITLPVITIINEKVRRGHRTQCE